MRWLVAALLVGCLTSPAAPAVEPSPECLAPCPTQIAQSDAFEPAVAVHGGKVLVAHTPFVDGLRVLELAAFNGTVWEVWRPDVLRHLEGCVHVFDPGAAFVDGSPVVTAIAGGSSEFARVIFSYHLDGALHAVRPDRLACASGSVPDFARISPDGVLTWRDLQATAGLYVTSDIAWSRWNGDWSEPVVIHKLGDPGCRGSSGPTPVVAAGRLVVAYQDWSTPYNQCLLTSGSDWSLATVTLLGRGALAWPTPVVVEDDVWVAAAVTLDGMEVPTVWRGADGWAAEHLRELASATSTTVAAAANGPRVALTAFQDADHVAIIWNGTWGPPIVLVEGTVAGHAMNLAGMGHYMGLVAEGDGFRAVWVEGEEGARRLMTAHIP